MLQVFEVLRSVAELDTTVLIHGETGVGKELLARSLHFSGPRRDKPFVAVNCAAIPAELFESELFGFRKGAFTSASESRRGYFQMANGGTLLLDEIGEMPLTLQSKLLRAIEEKRVTPIGSDRAVEIDVRRTRICSWRPTVAPSGAISSTGSPSCRSACRHCASGPATCRCWSSTSSRSARAAPRNPCPP
jgi:transcriptional regulator of aromatic amino acid metabolism